jgi:hypothetical protein
MLWFDLVWACSDSLRSASEMSPEGNSTKPMMVTLKSAWDTMKADPQPVLSGNSLTESLPFPVRESL